MAIEVVSTTAAQPGYVKSCFRRACLTLILGSVHYHDYEVQSQNIQCLAVIDKYREPRCSGRHINLPLRSPFFAFLTDQTNTTSQVFCLISVFSWLPESSRPYRNCTPLTTTCVTCAPVVSKHSLHEETRCPQCTPILELYSIETLLWLQYDTGALIAWFQITMPWWRYWN